MHSSSTYDRCQTYLCGFSACNMIVAGQAKEEGMDCLLEGCMDGWMNVEQREPMTVDLSFMMVKAAQEGRTVRGRA